MHLGLYMQTFLKHFYWVEAARVEECVEAVKKSLHLSSMPRARQRPCEVLNPAFPIMHVPPETWSANCYRQASWFRTSELNNSHLVVSNTPLRIVTCQLHGKITKISCSNAPSISTSTCRSLVQSTEFLQRVPTEWFHLLEREIPVFKSYLDRIGESNSLDELLDKHSANHAQFLQPLEKITCKIEVDHEPIPCSLFPSKYICSACMELFGVLGSHIPRKAIKNCPGLKYAPLDPREFFLVDIN